MTVPLNRTWGAAHLVEWYFGQSEFWITAKGDKVLVSKMGDGHAVNTLLMLERVASDIEPLLKVRVQETELYEALHKKVMSAVGEAMSPLAEIEDTTEPLDFGPLGDLLAAAVKRPAAEDGDSPVRKTWSERSYAWRYEPSAIKYLLTSSVDDFDVVIDYTDRNGRETTGRRVRVTEIRDMQSIGRPFPETRFMVKDRDADDETKVFYLSRIDRAARA